MRGSAVKIFGVKSFRERDKKKTSIKLSLPVLKIVNKKEADSASSNTQVLKKTKEGGPGSGRHSTGERVTHPYHGKGTYIKPNERPGQSIVVFDKEKPLYDAGMSKGHVVSNDLIKTDMHKESGSALKIKARFFENSNQTPKPTFETVGPYKFKVILIEEGMGNLVDGFYYSKEVLESAASLFEGKKIFADHPDKLAEETRPERTVRDIVGHFENVRFEIQEDSGIGCLYADAVTLPDDPYRWARALMRHAVDYSSKYPDKLFIGLSINAGGDASPANIKEFLASGNVVDAAKPKLQDAIEKGVDTIRVVNQIQSVVSADLVTEPGAGGRVLAILESEKGNEMKNKEEAKAHEEKHKEEGAAQGKPADKADGKKPPAPEAKKPAPKDDADGADGKHDDEDQDRELIAGMLKKALGSDAEVSEDALLAAKEAYEGYKEMGYKEEDAMQHASHSMKLAHHMAKKKEAMEADDHEHKEEADKPMPPKAKDDKDDDHDADDKEAHKESAQILKLQGEIAKLKESFSKREVSDYLEEKLAKSGLKREVTKKFKESVKTFRSKSHVDEMFNLFMEGYKQAEVGVSQATSLLFLEKEDTTEVETGGLSLTDCVKEF
jgi:hypothetical protein